MYQPTKEVDYRDAEKVLKAFFREKKQYVDKAWNWARWTYGESPFWAVSCFITSRDDPFIKAGVHIHDDGRVVVVSSTENWGEIEECL